jgi:hypothetical protein
MHRSSGDSSEVVPGGEAGSGSPDPDYRSSGAAELLECLDEPLEELA